MTQSLHIPFTIGDTYSITDVYDMMAFDAIYQGALENVHDISSDSNLLLFKIVKTYDGQSAYCGVTPRVNCHPNGITISLIADHYGKTATTIQRYNYSPKVAPKWVKI